MSLADLDCSGGNVVKPMSYSTYYVLHLINRWLFGLWLLYSFLIGAFYSSNLKSQLTMPVLVPSLDTLEEIVASNLPIKFVRYNVIEEEFLCRAGELHKRFCEKRVDFYQYHTPVRRNK